MRVSIYVTIYNLKKKRKKNLVGIVQSIYLLNRYTWNGIIDIGV